MEREHITDKAHGIDVSHYQEDYVFAETTGQVDFAIAKFGEGYNSPYSNGTLGDFTDFNRIWLEGCARVPIRGLYFYQRSGYSWERQADTFLNEAAKLDVQPHMIWCDIEKINNVVDKTMLADSLRIMDYWKLNSNYLIGSYSNKDIWQAYIYEIGMKYYGQEWFDRFLVYPVWYSQYWDVYGPDKPPSLAPCLNGKWNIYQYTDEGDEFVYVDGHQWRRFGSPDLNVFNGTVAEMRAWLKIGEEPPPTEEPPPVVIPPGDETMIAIATVLSGPRHVRSTPVIASDNLVGPSFLYANDLLEIAEINAENWGRIIAVRRAGSTLVLPGPVCWVSMGATFGYVRKEWEIETGGTVNVNPVISVAVKAPGYPDGSLTMTPNP